MNPSFWIQKTKKPFGIIWLENMMVMIKKNAVLLIPPPISEHKNNILK